MNTNQSKQTFWIIFYGVLTSVSIVIMPMLVNVMKDTFGLSVAKAGQIASLELAGVAVSTIAVASLLSRYTFKQLAIVSLLLIILGNTLSILLTEYIMICRLIAGIGSGASLALMSAKLATQSNPEKGFAYFFTSYLLMATVLFYSGIYIHNYLGATGVYKLISGFGIIALFVIVLNKIQGFPKTSEEIQQEKTIIKTDWKNIGVALFAMLLFFIATGSVWVYMGQIGAAAGVSQENILSVLGNATIAGAVGSLLSSFVASKLGRTTPLILSVVILMFLMTGIMLFLDASNFTIIALSFVFIWMFSMPFLMGIVAVLDPQGRAASLGIGAQNGGQSIGPAIASVLIVGSNFTNVALMGVICLGIALLLCVYVLLQIRK
ncbi:MFS transporter [Tenacibaculum amylolyticum]|uniref:MFS transporter n=1 Tax=Tenacibaculum amylolyticum TaxID=104269 RepID=UPI0038958D1E